MIRVLPITTGFSSFVPELSSCSRLSVVGVLNCQASVELEQFAKEKNIPYRLLTEQDDRLIAWITQKQPDVIAVFRMPFLLKKRVFSIPKYGSLNIHPSLLPKYKGANPWIGVFANKEKETGVTVHCINEQEDAGDILFQEKILIPPGAKLEELRAKSERIGVQLMIKALTSIETIKG